MCSDKMKKGYHKESRIGKVIEDFLRKGVDCIKAIPARHKFDRTLYLALGVGDEDHPYKRLCEICESLGVKDMEVVPKTMTGKNIKLERELMGLNPNPKYENIPLRLESERHYNVLEIKYLYCEIGTKLSQKADLSFLKPRA